MQKVITITTEMRSDSNFSEQEYPELNKYLDNGYQVTETILAEKPKTISETHMYAITFILTKVNI